jgi:hypothetical protein
MIEVVLVKSGVAKGEQRVLANHNVGALVGRHTVVVRQYNTQREGKDEDDINPDATGLLV